MRWIVTLVAMSLVALGAMRPPRAHASDRERHESTLDDVSSLVAKLAPRRPTAVAPDKRSERLDAIAPSPALCLVGPPQLALDPARTAPHPPWVPHLRSRTARGPPRASSPGIVSHFC